MATPSGVPLRKPSQGDANRAPIQEVVSAAAKDTRLTQHPRVLELPSGDPSVLSVSFAGPNLSAEDQAEAERRYRTIEPLVAEDGPTRFESLWRESQGSRTKLIARLAAEHGIGTRTLHYWLKNWRTGGIAALVRKGRSDKRTSRRFNAAALEFIAAAWLPEVGHHGEFSVRDVYRLYEEERAWRSAHATRQMNGAEAQKYRHQLDAETGFLKETAQFPKAPSYETFRRWIASLPKCVTSMARRGEEHYHNTQEPLSFRNFESIKPLDYVVMDHRLLDVFTLVPVRGGWKLARPWLTAACDMRTRKWLGWVIVESPSSDSIASVLKQIFLSFGIPKALYWDNGKDFTCSWLEGGATKTGAAYRIKALEDGPRGVLDTLGVRVCHAIVRRARSKLIEPAFGSISDYDRSLPWWCGHRPDARPERFNALLRQHEGWLQGKTATPAFPTISEVAALYDHLLSDVLNEREHTGEGMRKVTIQGHGFMCPNEAFELLAPQVDRRTISPEVLGFCFHKRRTLTVRNAEVQMSFGGRTYHYRPAKNSLGMLGLNGRAVDFSYDPLDLGVGCLYHEGQFVDLVVNAELRKMGEADFVDDERDRRRARRGVKDYIAFAHSQVPVPDPYERMARRRAVQPARIEPERQEVAAAVPAALLEAAQAKAEDDGFVFSGMDAAEIPLVVDQAPADGGDDHFDFFGGRA